MASLLRHEYQQRILSALQEALKLDNAFMTPRLAKIVVNVGLNVNASKDPKYLETVRSTLERITGQKPAETKARTSVSSFKVREGQVVGMMVTIRGDRLWNFLEKLVAVVLPRTRDFWGIAPEAVDRHGNLSIGFKEHLAFPEIRSDEVERVHGVEVTIVVKAKKREHALALYKALGVPFKSEKS